MKYLYLFINLLFNNYLKLLQTNSFCCKLIAGLLCWSSQDKTCSKSGHFTLLIWRECHPTGGRCDLGTRRPKKQACRWGLAHDDMPSAWWRDGEEVWPYVVNCSWTHFDVGRGWLLRHSASNRDILGLSFFFSNSTHHTHNPQTQLACSGTLTEQRPCISGSEV